MPYLGPGIDNGYRSRFIYTATAGQTSFSGGDSQGIALTYTDSEYLDVYQNGVLLVPGDDYAATTGTTVVLVQGASLNDKIEMIQYQAFGVADTVSRADGGAFGGNISTSGTLAVTGATTLTGALTVNDPVQILNGSNVRAASADADDLIVEGPADCGISILSATTGRIYFGDAANDDAGSIRYVHSDDSMRFETNDVEAMRISSIGAVTKPLQPAFMVKPASAQNGLAHNATLVFDSEIFDQNSDFANNTFTAPVTGRYQISFTLYFENVINNITNFYVTLELSNRSIYTILDPEAYDLTVTNLSVNFSLLCDMDASDTALLKYGKNGGGDTTNKNVNSYFSGYLVA